ncbi:MAG TPA: CmpA/NrtA family ABC transporter substrate-binding protein [Opitutaceae bacterium]|nr:CmpA/NrtA family ABC transporter substrate-binding protein [Opitutaceae bacterium]
MISTTSIPRTHRTLRIGFVALTDAAPLAVAEVQGFFAAHGLQVELHREIGWATIRDKIIYGELDAAQAPAPMLWSAQLGLNCPPCDVVTALVLNRHGNALTIANSLLKPGARDDGSLRELARLRHRTPLTLGVVFPFSSHNLLLRSWLRSIDLDPDRDVRIAVVPPGQVFRNLAAGTIDGFCAGEPWNSLAVRENLGWCRLCSAVQQPGHIEKVLMVTRRFAETRSGEHEALVAALAEACAWCDEPANRAPLAHLLAQRRFLNLPAAVIAPALVGRFDFGGRTQQVSDFVVFHRDDANVPRVSTAADLQAALVETGLAPWAQANPDLPARLFREDLYFQYAPRPHCRASSPDPTGSL